MDKPTHVRETKSRIWKEAIMPLGKTYPIHPYAKVFQFRDNVYSIFTKSFDGHGDPWMHLIVGPEKAMLIDTGFGIGNLKGLVEQLIGNMPLIVVNTHTHLDHTYGNCQFEKVYCHEYAVPVISQQNEHMWEHLYDKDGKGIWMDFDPKDIVPFKKYEIVGCKNNTVFNLGGDYDIELIFMPGHDPAHCVFLDKKDRILYGGDSILYVAGMAYNPKKDFRKVPYGQYGTVEALRNELEKLVKRMDEFDCIFMQHMVLGEDKQLVKDLFDACDAVVKDPDCNEYIHEAAGHVNKVKVCGMGAVEYWEGRLYMDTMKEVYDKYFGKDE